MKTILLLLDSLNRHYLSAYGGDWIQTPNLDRLVERGVVFDHHWSGSLPCMPARRDMMTGKVNFMETPWSPMMPWDDDLCTALRRDKGVYSHMVTDHYHYFHNGGEGYHTVFDSWEFERGQEGDVWRPVVELPPSAAGRGKALARGAYWRNRARMDTENDCDYPTPRTFQRAIEFLDGNHATDSWHLHLEVFDPHEPFDCPKRYRDLYDDVWKRDFFTWPDYAKLDPERDDEETVAHIRKCYAGVLTMTDVWLGKFLDRMDALDMWRDTTLILTTDHGHLLGEHGYWAKNYMFDYAELANIPLVVCAPNAKPGRRKEALTWTPDVMPTLLDLHGADIPETIHGKSLCHLFEKDEAHHESVLYGYFGKDVNWTDGRRTYCRQPTPGGVAYEHTLMPCGFAGPAARERLREAEFGVFLKNCAEVPHLRMARPSHRHHDAPEFNPIYDLIADPGQQNPLRNPQVEAELAANLQRRMAECDAPDSEFLRIGLPARNLDEE